MRADAYVVLGASGHLGSRIAALLAKRRRPTLLVGRRDDALRNVAKPYEIARTLACDLASRARALVFEAAESLDGQRLVIVDSVLDKTSSETMRTSTEAATRTAGELATRVRAAGRECLIVCASSIAAFAQWPYRTAYSNAKRQQASYYEGSKLPAAIVHLPVLYGSDPHEFAGIDKVLASYLDFDTYACSLDEAAKIIAIITSLPVPNEGIHILILTHRHTMMHLRGLRAPSPHSRIVSSLIAPIVVILGKGIFRNSPSWQRRAAYACRCLSPKAFWERRDHHTVPSPVQVRRPDAEQEGFHFYFGTIWLCDIRGAQAGKGETGRRP